MPEDHGVVYVRLVVEAVEVRRVGEGDHGAEPPKVHLPVEGSITQLLGLGDQLGPFAEHDGLGRTGMGASRGHHFGNAVGAHGALGEFAVIAVARYVEGTTGDAEVTSRAFRAVGDHRTLFVPGEGAGCGAY